MRHNAVRDALATSLSLITRSIAQTEAFSIRLKERNLVPFHVDVLLKNESPVGFDVKTFGSTRVSTDSLLTSKYHDCKSKIPVILAQTVSPEFKVIDHEPFVISSFGRIESQTKQAVYNLFDTKMARFIFNNCAITCARETAILANSFLPLSSPES